jgi:hypothetical protein
MKTADVFKNTRIGKHEVRLIAGIRRFKYAKKFILLTGLVLGLNFAGFFFNAWLSAFLSDEKRTLILINQFHEAQFELIVFPLMIFFMLIAIVVCLFTKDQ